MNNWTSIEDELPENGKNVLLCVHGRICIGYRIHISFGISAWVEAGDYSCREPLYPTHWQPLPKIPMELLSSWLPDEEKTEELKVGIFGGMLDNILRNSPEVLYKIVDETNLQPNTYGVVSFNPNVRKLKLRSVYNDFIDSGASKGWSYQRKIFSNVFSQLDVVVVIWSGANKQDASIIAKSIKDNKKVYVYNVNTKCTGEDEIKTAIEFHKKNKAVWSDYE